VSSKRHSSSSQRGGKILLGSIVSTFKFGEEFFKNVQSSLRVGLALAYFLFSATAA
jgi:hypothetical protein